MKKFTYRQVVGMVWKRTYEGGIYSRDIEKALKGGYIKGITDM